MAAAIPAARSVLVRPLLLAIVLTASVGVLDSLDLSLGAAYEDGSPVTRFTAVGLDEVSMIAFLDAGGTVRFTWQIRSDAADAVTVVRFARRDPLGEGYIVQDRNAEPLAGPLPRDLFLREITALYGYPLDAADPSGAPSAVEARLVIDRDPHAAPLGRGLLFGTGGERSPWRRLDLSEDALE